MRRLPKMWVLIRRANGRVQAWRDYGHVAWGSPDYTVLGYHQGTYREAMREARRLTSSTSN